MGTRKIMNYMTKVEILSAGKRFCSFGDGFFGFDVERSDNECSISPTSPHMTDSFFNLRQARTGFPRMSHVCF